MGRIICIGKNADYDDTALECITLWLREQGKEALAARIEANDLDHYDMATLPEKGDAIKAIARYRKIDMVLALHLFAIDRRPGFAQADMGTNVAFNRGMAIWFSSPRYYVGKNPELLPICMKRKIPLIAWGDQPDLFYCKVPVERQQIFGCSYLYTFGGKNDRKAVTAAHRQVR